MVFEKPKLCVIVIAYRTIEPREPVSEKGVFPFLDVGSGVFLSSEEISSFSEGMQKAISEDGDYKILNVVIHEIELQVINTYNTKTNGDDLAGNTNPIVKPI